MMVSEKATIMIVDDTADNLRILSEILNQSEYRVLAFKKGQMALDAIARDKPDLILLDIMMPEIDGYDFCQRLKISPVTKDIPVIFISALSGIDDKVKAFELGGIDYITKPFQAEEVLVRVKTHIKLHHLQEQLEDYNQHLEGKIDERAKELLNAQRALGLALAKLTELRDYETGQHIERVQNLCQVLACYTYQAGYYQSILTEDFIRDLFYASALHDIGKVGIPDDILLKQGKLDEMEFAIIKKHVDIGADTLEDVMKYHTNNSIMNMGVDVIKYHHEKWNGKGYNLGLSGENIPLSARIMALIDVYDALRSKRPYKEAWTHEDTCRLIESEKGQHFDPKLVEVFLNNHVEFDHIFTQIK